MAARIHRPLNIIAFNANDIQRLYYEHSKRLQDLHIDVAVLSGIHLKRSDGLFIRNYHFYGTDCFPGRKYIPQHM
jgi:hypothetical protein